MVWGDLSDVLRGWLDKIERKWFEDCLQEVVAMPLMRALLGRR